MTKTSVFARSVIIGASFGAVLWAFTFFLEAGEIPFSFWIRSGWFWAGVTRGAIAGWVLGVIVGAIIVLVLAIKNKLRRTKEESH
jgi:Na+/proline symporter